ncbi:vegetative cell wall protein gp1-like [Haliotis rubra]|uniref:vegetative cell wall protein gp1-like n=1 Tax=Haliotis rubra TaxID=36100 RepID=UPI001EE59E83|nr:vegetative cell wall protein gp1-like [Haliotis rubra]
MPTSQQSPQQVSGGVDMYVMDPNTASVALGGPEAIVAPGDPSLTNIVPNGPEPLPAPAIVPTQLTNPSAPQPTYIDPVINDPVPQTNPVPNVAPVDPSTAYGNLPVDPIQNTVTNLDPTAAAPIGVDGTAKPFTPTVVGQEPPPPSGSAPVGTGTDPASIPPPDIIQQGSAAPSQPSGNSLLSLGTFTCTA